MNRITALKIAIFTVAMLLLGVFSANAQASSGGDLIAYYTDFSGSQITLDLYNLKYDTFSIVSGAAGLNYAFSSDKTKVAFWNSDHLWMSDLAVWNPVLLYTSTDFNIAQALWMQDDTRILLADSLNGNPKFAFNLTDGKLEIWHWSECLSVVQNIRTLALGVRCSTDDLSAPSEVFYWGGSSVPFKPNTFRMITPVGNALTSGEQTLLDWTDQGQKLAYTEGSISSAPGVDLDGRISLNVVSELRRDPIQIISGFRGDLSDSISLSPDGKFVAFMYATGGGYDYSLNIYSTDTGQAIWDDWLEFDATNIYGIAWYPDGENLALVKFVYPTTYLSTVNVAQKMMNDQVLPQSPGNLAIIQETS